jgi:hypothetical protein
VLHTPSLRGGDVDGYPRAGSNSNINICHAPALAGFEDAWKLKGGEVP